MVGVGDVLGRGRVGVGVGGSCSAVPFECGRRWWLGASCVAPLHASSSLLGCVTTCYPPPCAWARSNEVITSKYTAANFVFKNLFQQFSRLFNLYFLFIAVLQVIPAVSITRGVPTLLVPLVFVVAASAAKEAAEDRRRHRADREENKRPVMVFSYESCSFVPMKWADVRVGMIVKYSNREPIAADTVLLQVRVPPPHAFHRNIRVLAHAVARLTRPQPLLLSADVGSRWVGVRDDGELGRRVESEGEADAH